MAKEVILDLREIDPDDFTDVWPDSLAHSTIENAVLDFAGKVVRVKITVVKGKEASARQKGERWYYQLKNT